MLASSINVFGEDNLLSSQPLNDLTLAYLYQGNYDEAIFYGTKYMTFCEQQYRTNHVYTAAAYHNLGLAHSGNNDLDIAMDYHQRALVIYKEQLGPNHVVLTAKVYHEIGTVHNEKNEIDEALEFYMKAVNIRETIVECSGDTGMHSELAATYNYIGVVCMKKGDRTTQLEYHLFKGKEIFEKINGEDHS